MNRQYANTSTEDQDDYFDFFEDQEFYTETQSENGLKEKQTDDVKGKGTYNPSQATARISANDRNQFLLVDKEGNPVRYDSEDKNSEAVLLPSGLKVIKLNPNPDNKDQIHVIAWYKGSYREGYLSSSAFDANENVDQNPFSVEVFIEDAEHTVHRSKEKLKETEKHLWKEAKAKNDQFRKLMDYVNKEIEKYKSGELQISPEILEDINKKHHEALSAENAGEGERIQGAEQAIHEVYDPMSSTVEKGDVKHSEETMVVPLSRQWFEKNENLKEYYETTWKNSVDGRLQRFEGFSGEGVSRDDESFEPIQKELLTLKGMMRNKAFKDGVKGTAEWHWLKSLKESNLDSMNRFIFIHDNAMEYTTDEHFGSSIALDSSFGSVDIDPMMTIMTHEMGVNTSGTGYSFLPSDTHVTVENAEQAWHDASAGKFQGEMINDQSKIDALYHSDAYLMLVSLAYVFKQIDKKND